MERMSMRSTTPMLELLDLIQSHRVTAVIQVAARLGIAELLRDGPRTLDELAKVTAADKDALGRLLTALSTLGICSLAAEDRYSLTEMAQAWMAMQNILSSTRRYSKGGYSPSGGTACWRRS